MPPTAARPAVRFRGAAFAAMLAALAVPMALAPFGSAALAQASRQHQAPDAEAFVEQQANRALAILNDGSMGVGAKKQAFYAFINQVADVPRITDFVLGRYRRSLTPAQYAAFSTAFRDYADSIYETRLSDYHGEQLKVTGSLLRNPNDVVVTSEIVGGNFRGQPSQVLWRLLRAPGGGWRLVDVNAQGVWLAVVEQQDFASTLANHNGDIGVLIRQLQADAVRGAPAKGG